MHRILLLGAGASVPFHNDPITTSKLTECIKDLTKWDKLINKYNSLIKPRIGITIETVSKVIKRANNINGNLNFEDIIELIDRYSAYNFDNLDNQKTLNNLLRFFNVRPNYKFEEIVDFPFLARHLIALEIEELQKDKASEYNGLIKKQNELFEYFLKADSLFISSLNYDELVLESIKGLNIETGYVNEFFKFDQYLCFSTHSIGRRALI